MGKHYEKDEELLLEIKEGDELFVQQVFTDFWEPFRAFFLKNTPLNEEEVLEIYTQSFTVFYFNITDEKLTAPLRSSLRSYLIGIGKNYVRRRWENNERSREINLEDWEIFQNDYQQPGLYDYYETEHQKWLIRKLLDLLQPFCRELLTLSFLKGNADDAIAQKLKLPSTGAVRFRRFDCLGKLRQLVRDHGPG